MENFKKKPFILLILAIQLLSVQAKKSNVPPPKHELASVVKVEGHNPATPPVEAHKAPDAEVPKPPAVPAMEAGSVEPPKVEPPAVPAEVPAEPHPGGGPKAKASTGEGNTEATPGSLQLGFDPSLINTEISKSVIDEYVQNVKFYLYDDPKNQGDFKQIVVGQADTLKGVTVPKKDGGLKVLIHGFMQDINSHFMKELKDALLHAHGDPVVCIDWGHMADDKFGPAALGAVFFPFIVSNIPTVGDYVGDFLIFLKEHKVIENFDQVYMIGYGLGAHVAGIAGGYIVQKTTEKLGRITGLDPTGPQFFLKTKERRLCFDDAKFVDVIHTSHLGYFMQLGHVDFFPNGGKFQPGCLETVGVVETVESLAAILAGSCAHARAWQYFVKSVRTNTMFGCECNDIFKFETTACKAECEDKMPFGDLTPATARGNYFLALTDSSWA